MTKDQFMKAMEIVSEGGRCTFKTSNNAGVYGDKSEGEFGLFILDCSHNVIKNLMSDNFTLSMKNGEMQVYYLG